MKKYLLTGLLVWVPLGITALGAESDHRHDGSKSAEIAGWRPDSWLGVHIPGLGVILTLASCWSPACLRAMCWGSALLDMWEGVLRRIPFVSAIYNSVKQVSDTLLSESGNAFGKVLLVRYPHPEAWSLAFQTTVPGEVTRALEGEEYVGVFIPTTPSPVNGFYFYVRKSDTIELDISVDAAFKAIISMGVVTTPEAAAQWANPTSNSLFRP